MTEFTRELSPQKFMGSECLQFVQFQKGASIFPDDDAPIVWVKTDKIKRLRGEIRRLYEDFCIIKDNGETIRVSCQFQPDDHQLGFLTSQSRGKNQMSAVARITHFMRCVILQRAKNSLWITRLLVKNLLQECGADKQQRYIRHLHECP